MEVKCSLVFNDLQGVEKTIVSKMLEKGSSRRIFPVDRHVGVVLHCLTHLPD